MKLSIGVVGCLGGDRCGEGEEKAEEFHGQLQITVFVKWLLRRRFCFDVLENDFVRG